MRTHRVYAAFIAVGFLAFACGDDKPPSKKNPQGGAGEGGEGSGAEASGGKSNGAGADSGGSSEQGGAEQGGTSSGGGGGDEGGAGPEPSITFTVVADQDVHPISPLIYGANVGATLDCADPGARFALCRRGEALWSAYNWENNATNAGLSHCHENTNALSTSNVPGAAVTEIIDKADTAGAASLVTLPMLAHVAADKTSGTPAPDCSGDVTKTANYLTTRFKQNQPLKGSALSLTPDTSDAVVSQDEFIAFLKANYSASDVMFSLDDETELWWKIHPALHPAKPIYDETVNLNVTYAKAVKETWPGAKVVGFVGYGFLAAVNLQESADAASKGPFFDYYLAKLKAASTTAGKRLVDYVDLHWYPELYAAGNERITNEAATSTAVEARVQAPRSLWDPDFIEASWIADALGGKPIELLPWLQGKVNANYPGTELSISEWSYGGNTHISGAVAAADALGVFGREGVGLAAVTSFSELSPYLLGAFQAFRNYDGAGNGFGDTSVFAASSDAERASVYASVDAADDSRMVLVAINRSAGELVTAIDIAHTASYASLTAYRIEDGQPAPALAGTIDAASPNSFSYAMPAYSVSVLVPSE